MKGINLAEKNGMWKGDSVGLYALHEWVWRRKPKPDRCENCGRKVEWLDLANISQEYKRDLSDWEYLCRKCHMIKDGRLMTFREFSRTEKKIVQCPICGKMFQISAVNKYQKRFCSMKCYGKARRENPESFPNWKGGISYDKRQYQKNWYRQHRGKSCLPLL